MTYRVGNHQPQNVYRDDAYIGVMFTAEDAALVVQALNGPTVEDAIDVACPAETWSWNHFLAHQVDAYWIKCTLSNPHVEHEDENTGLTWRDAEHRPIGDSCTCTKAGPSPDCPVHHGRRARGPKPPPVGEGCICDGSGRTCPRHGAVS